MSFAPLRSFTEVLELTDDQIRAELQKRSLPTSGQAKDLRTNLFYSVYLEEQASTSRLPTELDPEIEEHEVSLIQGNHTVSTVCHTQTFRLNQIGVGRGRGREFRSPAKSWPMRRPGQMSGPQTGQTVQPRTGQMAHPQPVERPQSVRYQSATMTAYEIMRKWDFRYTGEPHEDVDMFLGCVQENREYVEITDENLLKCATLLLSGIARHWYKLERPKWETWEECAIAFRQHFGDPDFNEALREEARTRIQGRDEAVTTYFTCMRNYFLRAVPRFSVAEQIDIVHRNILPKIQVLLPRHEIASLSEMEKSAARLERCFLAARVDRTPVPPVRSLLPEFAYHPPEKSGRPVTFGVLDKFSGLHQVQGGENTSRDGANVYQNPNCRAYYESGAGMNDRDRRRRDRDPY